MRLSVSFSSCSGHALCDMAQLLKGISLTDYWRTSFTLDSEGWMKGPNNRLLFWVPPGSREPFYTPFTRLIISRKAIELDLSCMAHGKHWQGCQG
ncbi:hypothetical protein BU17DRAFT_43371 [Hysterangium stoloniferum]|nr:hypothetical protein BU17DRAFT_43371 [Hysterangium stoloniferum]